MHNSFQTFLSLLLLPVLCLAAPTADHAHLAPRACSTRTPAVYRISAAAPNDATLTDTVSFKREGPPYKDTVSTVLIFSGFPDGATGCTLHYILPKSTTSTPYASANPDYSQAFSGDVSLLRSGRLPTFNTPGQKIAKVASIQVPTKPTTEQFETNVWAGNCPSNYVPRDGPYASQLQFVIEASDWQQASGEANIPNRNAAQGFSIVYNC